MANPFVAQVGAVLSADIAVPDHEREVRFYSRVLTTGENPLWGDDLMNNLGVPIIGLGPRTDEHAALPLQWMPHIQVADVASSVQRARDLGGQVLMQQQDDDGNGGWAVLLDPNGAAFGLVPLIPEEMLGAATQSTGEGVGYIMWLDLTVQDAAATRDFYSQVVGWSAQDVDIEGGDEHYADYNMLRADDTPAAGVCHARGVNTGLPPVWLLYLPVGDLEESVRRVESEGGKVVKAMRGDNGEYLYAAVQDPVGAHFALLQG